MELKEKYQDINSKIIDRWVTEKGWKWGIPISSEVFNDAKSGKWDIVLTPTKFMPHEWIGDIKGKKLLGLASGGGQQMPIFAALGAICTVLDYSKKQIETEEMVAKREGYSIKTVVADMTEPLPFENESFDIIFHPVSNCFIEKVEPVFKECYRVLKKGGIFVGGFDNGINYLVDKDETKIINKMPFNPLKNEDQYKQLMDIDDGIEFSHTIEEQIGGQLAAGFILTDLYEDTNGSGRLHNLNIYTFIATRAIKK